MQAHADPLTGLDLDSREYRQRAPRVELSNDPDIATQQTVQEMCRQIHQAASDPLIRLAADDAVRRYGGNAAACFWWCKANLQFKHHGSMFERWAGDLGDPRTKLQLLIAPDVLVRMRKMEGDCAIYTMMVCSMLEALGLPWQIVTLAVDRQQPEIFSHVCARSNGETLDASHGSYPGWMVPAYDIHRAWVFDSNGQRVSDQSQGMGRFNGLHAYRRHGRGMGVWVCTDPSNADSCYDDGITMNIQPATSGADTATGYLTAGYPSGSMAAPSQNSAQWATFSTNLAKMGFTLAEINSIQPGTVVSANGAILRQATGLPVPVGTVTAALGSNGILYIGLAAVAALFLFKGGK